MEIFEILTDQLYQSGAPQSDDDWAPILERNIDVVVDLYGGLLDPGVPTIPNTIVYVFWPIIDGPLLPDLSALEALTDAACRLVRGGHRVLVHCHQGKSRSGLFNAMVLMKLRGIDGRTAIAMVRQARPGALGNEAFTAYLEGLPAPKI